MDYVTVYSRSLQRHFHYDKSPAEIRQSISKRGGPWLVRGGDGLSSGSLAPNLYWCSQGPTGYFRSNLKQKIIEPWSTSNPLNNGCNALSSADAHRYQRIASACAVPLLNSLDRNDCPGGTYRMSKRNSGAIGVDLGRVEVQLLSDGTGLRSKSLV